MSQQEDNPAISKNEFENWLIKIFDTNKPPSLRKVASCGALSKSTLAYQLKNDAVDPTAVLAIARGMGRNPVKELSGFTQFNSLAQTAHLAAADTEILYALAVPDILREILRRYSVPVAPFSLAPVSPAQVWGRWFRACAPHVSGKDIQQVTGISQNSVSRNQQLGGWRIEHIFTLSKRFGLHLPIALITGGFISWAEAGYTEQILEERVVNFSTELLAECLSSVASKLPRDIALDQDHRVRNIAVEYLA